MRNVVITGVSTGIGGGITLEERYTLGIRYLYANPGYEVTITDLGVTSTDHAHQPTALIMVSLGLAL